MGLKNSRRTRLANQPKLTDIKDNDFYLTGAAGRKNESSIRKSSDFHDFVDLFEVDELFGVLLLILDLKDS